MQNEHGTFIASNDEDKAEVLADFFSNVFTHENTDETLHIDTCGAIQHETEPITQEEVRKLLKELDTSKS